MQKDQLRLRARMQNKTSAAFMLFMLLAAIPFSHAEEDWQVTTSPEKKLAYKHGAIYAGVQTQEAWDKEFEKAFKAVDAAACRYLARLAQSKGYAFDVNQQDAEGRTLLHKAVTLADPNMTRFLLSAGAQATITDNEGEQPLHAAIKALAEKNVALILKTRKVNIDEPNKRGEPPLALAVLSGNETMIRLLLQHGSKLDFKIENTPFDEWVLEKDNVAGFKLIYHAIDVKNLKRDAEGLTLLHKAAKLDAARITAFLLKKGANPRTLDGTESADASVRRKIPLEYAILNMHIETIKSYVAFDRKFLNFRDPKTSDTLLHIALETGNFALVDFLLKYKIRFDVINDRNEFPIDTLKRFASSVDQTDAELLKKIAFYEKRVAVDQNDIVRRFAKAVATENVTEFSMILVGVRDTDLYDLYLSLVDEKKPKLLKTLLEKRGAALTSNHSVFEDVRLYKAGWIVFDVVYRGVAGKGFNTCFKEDECPPLLFLRNSEPEVVSKALALPGFLNSLKDQPIDELDRSLTLAKERRVEASSLVEKKVATDEIDRLNAVIKVLGGYGVLTAQQQTVALERLVTHLKNGKGIEILKSYRTEVLTIINDGEAFKLALLFDDTVLTEALIPYLHYVVDDLKTGDHLLFASKKMKALLARHKIGEPATHNCADLFSVFTNADIQDRLAAWVNQTQLSHCADADVALTRAIRMYKPAAGAKVFEAIAALPRISELIKKYKGDLNSVNGKIPPLVAAASNCKTDLVKRLLELGASVESFYGDETALFSAVNASFCPERSQLTLELVKAGANPNHTTKSGGFALFRAIVHRDIAAADVLLDAGAEIFPRSLNTPERSAVEHAALNIPDFFELIKKRGIDPVAVRSCEDWQDQGLVNRAQGGTREMNEAIHWYRQFQKEKAKKASCDDVAKMAKAEYAKAVSNFDKTIENWRNLALKIRGLGDAGDEFTYDGRDILNKSAVGIDEITHAYTASGSFCCGYNTYDRCLSQLVCDKKQDARDLSAPFCDRFADGPAMLGALQLELGMARGHELKKFEHHYKKFHIEPAKSMTFSVGDGENVTLLKLVVPLHVIPSKDMGKKELQELEQKDLAKRTAVQKRYIRNIVAAQLPELHRQMGLSSLSEFMKTKYPHCSR